MTHRAHDVVEDFERLKFGNNHSKFRPNLVFLSYSLSITMVTNGVATGGNLVLQTMPHLERLMLSSTPASIKDTNVLGPHSLAQTVPRTTEIVSNEHGGGV
ncbi:hypothetical protein Hdeb2414_s0022g00618771 [Helianthus debilis subsp. tardiflorus]